jgi:hypothetical protein
MIKSAEAMRHLDPSHGGRPTTVPQALGRLSVVLEGACVQGSRGLGVRRLS